ncbi:MAG: phospholipase D-like domain-containing protein [Longimicrobiales bacterium]
MPHWIQGTPWWLLTLAGIGSLAAVSAIITLFSSLGRRPRETTVTAAPPMGSIDFLEAISGAVNAPLRTGGQATLLNNGDAFFPEILSAIRGAQWTINFFVYIWEPGEASRMVIDALVDRAQAGVQVRVLLDGIGGFRAPRADIRRLKAAGGRVNRFRALQPGKLLRLHKRNHRRAIVIDGNIGFTGGAAIGDKWLGHAQDPKHWRDSMVKVTDCMAVNLQSAFAEPWAYTCGELLVGPEFWPVQPNGDGAESATRHVHLVSSPSSEEHPVRLFFALSFMAARKTLYIATSYFVPDRDMREIVAERARQGVDVRILVPNWFTDARPIRLAGRSYYDDLLSAGVRIYEYQRTMMHCKHVVIDQQWSIVGSANMDVRSKELNQENVLGILDTGFARQIEESFLRDLEQAQELKLDAWRRRNYWERAKERFWVLFAEQY